MEREKVYDLYRAADAAVMLERSPDADVARQVIMRELAKQLKKEHGNASVSITLSEAKIFNASDIVPAHFTKEYLEQAKVEDYVMDGQRVSNRTI